MTLELYNAIANHLLTETEVVWVDLFGSQGNQTENEYPIQYPAAFIDYRVDEITASTSRESEVFATIIIHLLIETYTDSHRTPLNPPSEVGVYNPLIVKHNIIAALTDFKGDCFRFFDRISERMNPDYDALNEYEIEFRVKYQESHEKMNDDGSYESSTIRVPKPAPEFEKEIVHS